MLSAQAVSAAMATPATKLVVEYAKSGKASCKHCGERINIRAVRLGAVVKTTGYEIIRWHHPKCFLATEIDAASVSAEDMRGFTVLKESDRAALRTLLFSATNIQALDKRRKLSPGSALPTLMEHTDQIPLRYDAKSWEITLSGFDSSRLGNEYKDAQLPIGWRAFSTIIFYEAAGVQPSEKIAAFDFDGCLANTDVRRSGPDEWSLQYPSIPQILQHYYQDGFKLVIYSNESNIERWSKLRQKAVDSKLGRVMGLLRVVDLPVQVFISCGKEGTRDPCRKPSPGMWHVMERHLNGGVPIDKERSFYVGDAAGRKNDHSAADIGFSKAVGVKFYVPEEVFLLPPPPVISDTVTITEKEIEISPLLSDTVAGTEKEIEISPLKLDTVAGTEKETEVSPLISDTVADTEKEIEISTLKTLEL